MKVNFVVRRTKKKLDGKVPIEMTISVKGKRRYVSTGREVKPSDFSSKTQTVKGNAQLNEFLKAPFVCIEPWYGLGDPRSFQGAFKDKPLMNHLLPGASFMSKYDIIIG